MLSISYNCSDLPHCSKAWAVKGLLMDVCVCVCMLCSVRKKNCTSATVLYSWLIFAHLVYEMSQNSDKMSTPSPKSQWLFFWPTVLKPKHSICCDIKLRKVLNPQTGEFEWILILFFCCKYKTARHFAALRALLLAKVKILTFVPEVVLQVKIHVKLHQMGSSFWEHECAPPKFLDDLPIKFPNV